MATSSQYGSFVPTNLVWDVAQLQEIDVTSPEFKELLVRLYQNINNIANVLNIKDTGIYNNSFFSVNGQLYFPNPVNNSSTPDRPAMRQVFRQVFIVPAGGTLLHKLPINANWQFTRIYGVANDPVGNNYYPLPWASAAGATNIELKVNLTQIVITNNSGIAFPNFLVVLEWIDS